MKMRALTAEERMMWGVCPTCGAKPNEPCEANVGFQLGHRLDGSRLKTGDGAHLSRLYKAPYRVREDQLPDTAPEEDAP